MHAAIGIIELSSIASGFKAQDAMLKTADVEVANVSASLEAGKRAAAGFLVDTLYLPNIDKRILPALSGCVPLPEHPRALGIIETFSAASCIEAADAAIKAAQVTLFRIHAAMAIGGKGFLLLCGDVTAVQTAVEAGCQRIKDNATLVNREVISGASRELFQEYL